MVKVMTAEPVLTDWSVAARAVAGESVPGDMYLVRQFDDGELLAVVDGMGHGKEATRAARTAVSVLQQFAGEPITALVNRCHAALQQTRGACITLAALNARAGIVTWLGVGNVEGRLFRVDPRANHPIEHVLLRAGVVGYQLPALRAAMIPIGRGDLLVFVTDGIDESFAQEVHVKESLPALARRILDRHAKGHDDALVLVARYLGPNPELGEPGSRSNP